MTNTINTSGKWSDIAADLNQNFSDLDTEQGTQNTRLDDIETLNGTQNTRLDDIETLNGTQNTRLDNIDTLNNTQTSRLDGIDTLNNTQNTRLDDVETVNTTQDGRLNIIEAARTEADMEAMRKQNNELYAASSFVHFGKHYSATNYVPINEGMWTHQLDPNSLRVGDNLSRFGESKTAHPIVNLAGFTSHISYLNETLGRGKIKFPAAPNGTVVYDSSDGSIVDHSVDPSPQYIGVSGYETVAERAALASSTELNEMVSSAFEGMIRNGDFRFGDNGDWTGSAWTFSTNGATTSDGSTNFRPATTLALTDATNYILEIVIADVTAGTLNIEVGSANVIASGLSNGKHTIPFTSITGSDPLYCYGAGFAGTVKSLSLRKATNQVVTERVDLFGLEAFLRPIPVDAFVYPNGLIQSQATTMDGISTADEVARPDSFFSVFDGDTTANGLGSRGKGLDFHNLSATDQAKVLANPDNNIFRMEDGTICQWSIRQRTIAGAGNHDWYSLNSYNTTASGYASLARLKPQGVQDTVVSLAAGATNDYLPNNHMSSTNAVTGLLVVNPTDAASYSHNAECYFYVLGVVPRLNSGCFHPEFNNLGTANFTQTGVANYEWYTLPANSVLTTKDCFLYATTSKVGVHNTYNGTLGGGTTKHPSKKYHDIIYSSGQNGVCDYRMSAWDASSAEKANEVFKNVRNGSYRGREKLKWTFFDENTVTVSSVASYDPANSNGSINFAVSAFDAPSGYKFALNKKATHWFLSGDNGKSMVIQRTAPIINDHAYWPYTNNTIIYLYNSGDVKAEFDAKFPIGTVLHIGAMYDSNTTVEGTYQYTDMVGDPASLVQIEQLKGGWAGGWNPTIPDDVTRIQMTRKRLDTGNMDYYYTLNNGVTWDLTTVAFAAAANDKAPSATGLIAYAVYDVYAQQTLPSINLPVLHSDAGIMKSVFATSDYRTNYGCLLIETLLGKIGTDSGAETKPNMPLTGYTFDNDKIHADINAPLTHHALPLPDPSGGEAVKLLPYQTAVNNQATLNFAYNELVWDSDAGTAISVTVNTAYAYEVGKTYQLNHVDFDELKGTYWTFKQNTTNTPVQIRDSLIGYLHNPYGESPVAKLWLGNGWGDDDILRIKDGHGTYINDNGDICLYGTDQLAIPYGWVKQDK